MPNGIRDPKEGNNETSRRIAQAVDNREWQQFRVSIKGMQTKHKLEQLVTYYYEAKITVKGLALLDQIDQTKFDTMMKDIEIRVDNYLKALARGGQLAVTDDYLTALVEGGLVIRR